MPSRSTRLRHELKAVVKKHPEIEDILLFGSTVRGKGLPADTDILVLFKEKVDKEIEYVVRKVVEKEYPRPAMIAKTRETVLDPSFDARESILFEGISLLDGKSLAGSFGMAPVGLFKYDLFSWNKTRRTQFYYALKGRDGKSGIMQEMECMRLSDRLIIAPLHRIEPLRDFLQSWNINYQYIPLLLPGRLLKKGIIEQ